MASCKFTKSKLLRLRTPSSNSTRPLARLDPAPRRHISNYQHRSSPKLSGASSRKDAVRANSISALTTSRPFRYYASLSSTQTHPTPSPLTYDLIVVGHGLAGCTTALTAAENGLKVLLLDASHGGGASKLSGGVVYAGGGTAYQKAASFDDSPENMFNYLKLEVGNAVDEATLRRFCEESVERLEWLEKYGARFDAAFCPWKTSYPTDKYYLYFSGNEKAWPFNEAARPVPRGHRTHEKGLDAGRSLWTALANSATKMGIEFQPLSRVNTLLTDSSGRVTGVQYSQLPREHQSFNQHKKLLDSWTSAWLFAPERAARLHAKAETLFTSSAEPRTAHARAGVVLAAGGFAFNKELRAKYLPSYAAVGPLGTPTDDGAGIALGQKAGGTTSHMDKMSAWRFLTPPAAYLYGIAIAAPCGERIAAEDLYGATFTESLIHKHGGRGCLILDSEMWGLAKRQFGSQSDWPMKLLPLSQLYWNHWRANSISGLAGKIGVDSSTMENSIEAYNEGLRSGKGDPFHKTAEYSRALVEPPFYAIDISVRDRGLYQVPGITLGGLKVNGETGLVLREDGTRIEGLYAAGRNAVGICSNSYISGLSLADCVFSGMRAGKQAAKMLTGA